MKVDIVPELKPKIEAAAKALSESREDSVTVEGGDNMMLVRADSDLGREMLSKNRVLFPYETGDKAYHVCIAQSR